MRANLRWLILLYRFFENEFFCRSNIIWFYRKTAEDADCVGIQNVNLRRVSKASYLNWYSYRKTVLEDSPQILKVFRLAFTDLEKMVSSVSKIKGNIYKTFFFTFFDTESGDDLKSLWDQLR